MLLKKYTLCYMFTKMQHFNMFTLILIVYPLNICYLMGCYQIAFSMSISILTTVGVNLFVNSRILCTCTWVHNLNLAQTLHPCNIINFTFFCWYPFSALVDAFISLNNFLIYIQIYGQVGCLFGGIYHEICSHQYGWFHMKILNAS